MAEQERRSEGSHPPDTSHHRIGDSKRVRGILCLRVRKVGTQVQRSWRTVLGWLAWRVRSWKKTAPPASMAAVMAALSSTASERSRWPKPAPSLLSPSWTTLLRYDPGSNFRQPFSGVASSSATTRKSCAFLANRASPDAMGWRYAFPCP